jgi:HEAT repeat protein
VSGLTPAGESADLAWLDAAVASGDVGVYGHAFRSRVFGAVGADRSGPVVRRLLALAADTRPSVRLTVLRLLNDLCPQTATWDPVAEVAAVAMRDPDEAVRRAAAWLLGASAGMDRAIAALFAAPDPVARVALAEAIWVQRDHDDRWPEVVARMRRDDVPPVRFLGSLAALLTAGREHWPVLDAAVRGDLEPAAEVLGGVGDRISWGAGERWGTVLARRDREEESYDLVERLLRRHEPGPVRRAGVDIAAEAMRTWRAAPSRLTSVLSTALAEPASGVRGAAVEVLCASLTATRLAADDLAGLLGKPELSAAAATALGCIGDQRAVPALLRMMRAGEPHSRLAAALAAVVPTLPDPTSAIITARQVLACHHDPCHEGPPRHRYPAFAAVHCLAALGKAAACAVPDLTARLHAAVDHGDPSAARLEIFALQQIGPSAQRALPPLRELVAADGPTADLATRALLAITQDRSVADDYLDARPEQLRHCGIAPHLLDWLTDHGGLTDRQARQLDHLFQPRAMQVQAAAALWRHTGPAAVPVLLAELPKYLDDDTFGPIAMKVLAAMGPFARPALPDLDRLIRARHRVTVYLGDADAEMRADEQLLDAATATYARIAAATG